MAAEPQEQKSDDSQVKVQTEHTLLDARMDGLGPLGEIFKSAVRTNGEADSLLHESAARHGDTGKGSGPLPTTLAELTTDSAHVRPAEALNSQDAATRQEELQIDRTVDGLAHLSVEEKTEVKRIVSTDVRGV